MIPVIARSFAREPSKSNSMVCRLFYTFWLLAMSKAKGIDWRSLNLYSINKNDYTYAVKGFFYVFSKESTITVLHTNRYYGKHEIVCFNTVIARSEATKQSQQGSQTTPWDCFANARNDTFLMKRYTSIPSRGLRLSGQSWFLTGTSILVIVLFTLGRMP